MSKRNFDLKKEEKLQAVVIADSYNKKFRPLSYQKPRALIPIVNTPLIDYTLEFLASGGVEHIIVFCTSNAGQIQDHIDNSKWAKGVTGVKVECMIGVDCHCTGDALRHIDNLDIIENDFILVSGDVVANLDLRSLVQKHRQRCAEDPDAIMTTVFKKATSLHRTRSYQDDTLVFLDSETGELVHYGNTGKEPSFKLQTEFFGAHNTVQMRYDLLDCHIDICSRRVLMSFTENFDYEDLRIDFIKGVLESGILGYKIFTHILDTSYAARVRCLRTYAAVSKDIIRRWSYPFVPDNNLSGTTAYKLTRGGIIKDSGIHMDRTSKLQIDTVVARHTTIGKNTVITRSVIGKNVTIGANCVIEDAYIWDNAVIGENVEIRHSIIANDAVVCDDCTISRSCVIGFGCKIAKGMFVKENTKITSIHIEVPSPYMGAGAGRSFSQDSVDEDDEDAEDTSFHGDAGSWNEDVVGPGGIGRVWKYKSQVEERQNMLGFQIDQEVVVDYESEEEDLSEDMSGGKSKDPFESNMDHFFQEVRDSMEDAIENDTKIENVTVEIQGSKYAHDTTFSDCACAMLPVFLEVAEKKGGSNHNTLLSTLKKILEKWVELFQKFLHTESDQLELIFQLQEVCEPVVSTYHALFQYVLKLMYDVDLVTEEAILKWASIAEDGDEEQKWFLSQAKPFLDWLANAESDSDDDDDDDDDDESGSESESGSEEESSDDDE